MLTDRLMKIAIGAIAILLAALVLQVTFKSPTPAQAAFAPTDAPVKYEVRLISKFTIPKILQITPLGVSAQTGVHFAVNTKDTVYVYRCDYASK